MQRDGCIWSLCRRWWAFKVLSRIPHEEHDEVMLKAAAFDCLGGKRKNWALQTRWHGNYLAKVRLVAECAWNATQHCNVGTMWLAFKTMSQQCCDAEIR